MTSSIEALSSEEFFQEVWRRYTDPSAFVTRLREALKAHGITQSRLAATAGFQQPNVSVWLTGRKAPSMATMLLLDEALEKLIASFPSSSTSD